jgi:hypothetical protein
VRTCSLIIVGGGACPAPLVATSLPCCLPACLPVCLPACLSCHRSTHDVGGYPRGEPAVSHLGIGRY